MKKLLFTVLCAAALAGCNSRTAIPYGGTVTLSEEVLRDKIKGGWAGQTIGCTFGGPTEFKYKGGIIHDEVQFVCTTTTPGTPSWRTRGFTTTSTWTSRSSR